MGGAELVPPSFFALLDDIAVLARAAAASIDDVMVGVSKASVKATGLIIDDAAVTPQYVQGISPKRELPVVWRIAKGSLLNKAIIIAAILPLNIFLPQVLPWLLIVGGTYLAYEGAEKVWEWVTGGGREQPSAEEIKHRSPQDEKQIIRAALRTDIVLSAEIMLISLATIDNSSWWTELAILILVALVMTVGVYGVVGLLIKLDDAGLWLMRSTSRIRVRLGKTLVQAMPVVFSVLTVVGVVAMLWIGGQILIENFAALGWSLPHALLARLTSSITAPGPVLWLLTTVVSALAGLVWGLLITAVMVVIHRVRQARKVAA